MYLIFHGREEPMSKAYVNITLLNIYLNILLRLSTLYSCIL